MIYIITSFFISKFFVCLHLRRSCPVCLGQRLILFHYLSLHSFGTYNCLHHIVLKEITKKTLLIYTLQNDIFSKCPPFCQNHSDTLILANFIKTLVNTKSTILFLGIRLWAQAAGLYIYIYKHTLINNTKNLY